MSNKISFKHSNSSCRMDTWDTSKFHCKHRKCRHYRVFAPHSMILDWLFVDFESCSSIQLLEWDFLHCSNPPFLLIASLGCRLEAAPPKPPRPSSKTTANLTISFFSSWLFQQNEVKKKGPTVDLFATKKTNTYYYSTILINRII